ncbi:hypothetical protein JW962_03510 [Candidatus Dojkabacteria bacterium]|nr:hypothetical protein [Candidatus Dojkabacteria bacterium]
MAVNPIRGPVPQFLGGPRGVMNEVNAVVQRPAENVFRWIDENLRPVRVIGRLAQRIGNAFDAVDNVARGVRPGVGNVVDQLDALRGNVAQAAANVVDKVPLVGHRLSQNIEEHHVIAGKEVENLDRRFYKKTRGKSLEQIVDAQLHYNAKRAEYEDIANQPTVPGAPNLVEQWAAGRTADIDLHGREELAQIDPSDTAAIDKKRKEIAARLMADEDMRGAVLAGNVMDRNSSKAVLDAKYGRANADQMVKIIEKSANAMTPTYGEVRGEKRLTQVDTLSTDDPRLGVRLDIASDIVKKNALDAASKEFGRRIADPILEGQKVDRQIGFFRDGKARDFVADLRAGLSKPPTADEIKRLEKALNKSPFNQRVDIDDRLATPGSRVGPAARALDVIWREIYTYEGLRNIDLSKPKDRNDFRKTVLCNIYGLDTDLDPKVRDMQKVTAEAKKIADANNPADKANAISALMANTHISENMKFAILFDAAVTKGKNINGTQNIEQIIAFMDGKTMPEVMQDLANALGVADLNSTAPGINNMVDYVFNMLPDVQLLVETPDGDLNQAMCEAFMKMQLLVDMDKFMVMKADGSGWEFAVDANGIAYCPPNLQPAVFKYMEMLGKDRNMGNGFLKAVGEWAIANAGGAMGVTIDQLPDRFFNTQAQNKRETPKTLRDLEKNPQLADALRELGLTPAEQARIIKENETSLLGRLISGSKEAFQKLVRGGAFALATAAVMTTIGATLGAPVATGLAVVMGIYAAFNVLRGGSDTIVGFVRSGAELLNAWIHGEDKDRLAEKQQRFKVALKRLGAFALGAAGGAAMVVGFGNFAGVIASLLMIPAEKVSEVTRLMENKSRVKKLMQEIADGTIAGLSEEEKAARRAEFRKWIEKEDRAKNFWTALVSGVVTGAAAAGLWVPKQYQNLGGKAIQRIRASRMTGPTGIIGGPGPSVTPPAGPQTPPAGGTVTGDIIVEQGGNHGTRLVPFEADANGYKVTLGQGDSAGVGFKALFEARKGADIPDLWPDLAAQGNPFAQFVAKHLYNPTGAVIQRNVFIDFLRNRGVADPVAFINGIDQKTLDVLLRTPGTGRVVAGDVLKLTNEQARVLFD